MEHAKMLVAGWTECQRSEKREKKVAPGEIYHRMTLEIQIIA